MRCLYYVWMIHKGLQCIISGFSDISICINNNKMQVLNFPIHESCPGQQHISLLWSLCCNWLAGALAAIRSQLSCVYLLGANRKCSNNVPIICVNTGAIWCQLLLSRTAGLRVKLAQSYLIAKYYVLPYNLLQNIFIVLLKTGFHVIYPNRPLLALYLWPDTVVVLKSRSGIKHMHKYPGHSPQGRKHLKRSPINENNGTWL